MEKLCDLHTHSVFSDGTYTPAQLIEEAQEIGLSGVALCDHNTVAGLPEFMAAAENTNVEAVPGIEFSTDYEGTELHMLGLFLKPQYFVSVTELLEPYLQMKEESNRNLVEALGKAGYHLDFERIKASTPNGQLNRAHIAAALMEKGYTASVKEAFKTLLSKTGGYYREPPKPDVFEVISFIRSIGSVAVLAHPYLSLPKEQVPGFLRQAKKRGLNGMEILYSTYDEETTELAAMTAKKYDLLPSGGSDFHGANKPDIRLGRGKGNLAIPFSCLERLRDVQKM